MDEQVEASAADASNSVEARTLYSPATFPKTNGAAVAETPPLRALTPETQAFIQDEPPSVLASRIMRAHDNPSPPPQLPHTFDDSNLPTLSLPFPLLPAAKDSSPEAFLLLPDTPNEHPTNDTLDQFLSLSTYPVVSAIETDDEEIVTDAPVWPTDAENNIAGPSSEPSTPPPRRRSSRSRRSTARYTLPIHIEQIDQHNDEYIHPNDRPKIPGSPRKTVTLLPYTTTTTPPDLSILSTQPRARSRSPSRISAATAKKRELGSLSPSSVTILTTLVPPATSPLRQTPEPDTAVAPVPKTPPVAPPIRFTSPIRRTSPDKFTLHPAAPNDPNRTPARRVFDDDAVASRQASPNKSFNFLNGGHFSKPVFNTPSKTSPAKRILSQDTSLGRSTRKMLGSPMRSRSVEPSPAEPPQLKKRSDSVEPTGLQSSRMTAGRPSPFERSNSVENALAPAATNFATQPTIPEEESNSTTASHSQPMIKKSRLKQPTSKIPRIGSKPYARSAVSTSQNITETHIRTTQSSATKPKAFNSSAPSRIQVPSSIPVPSPMKTNALVPSTPMSLKRKRGPDGISPTKITPIVLLPAPKYPVSRLSSPDKKFSIPQLRMVSEKDGILPNRPKPAVSASHPKTELAFPPTSINRPIQKLRMVSHTDGILPDRSAANSSGARSISSNELPVQQSSEMDVMNVEPSISSLSDSQIVNSQKEEELSLPPIDTIEQTVDIPSSSPIQADELISSDTVSGSSPPLQMRSPSPVEPFEVSLRRTTRSSRNGTSTPRPPRPPPARRKNTIVFQDTGPFSGMTALALRTLTDTNTTKNKEYITALLQTEIIRKEGARPESPGMIIKSISQKAKEANARGRDARAERRAKRDDKGKGRDENLDCEGEDEREDESDRSPSVLKHAWGPGDEEDYESPIRPMKRLRLVDHELEEDAEDKKRVKWDRGLFQQIYLDEIKPRTTHSHATHPSIKGCLAPTSKIRGLDTLGNIPNAESPLKDLMKENVVVKKFVYDDDVEPVPEPPPLVKTRSKSKKSKS